MRALKTVAVALMNDAPVAKFWQSMAMLIPGVSQGSLPNIDAGDAGRVAITFVASTSQPEPEPRVSPATPVSEIRPPVTRLKSSEDLAAELVMSTPAIACAAASGSAATTAATTKPSNPPRKRVLSALSRA